MKRHWMPLYPSDYLADTGHLTTAEHGCYLLLIMHYWQHGCLPNDDGKLARICRCRNEDWNRRYRKVVLDFFQPSPGGYRHARIDREIGRCEEISSKRKAAAVQMHAKKHANAYTTTSTLTKKESKCDERANARPRSFGEYDYLSSDEAVHFTAQDIQEMAVDNPAIKDIRAALRQTDRAMMESNVEPERRQAAIRHALRNQNLKAIERVAAAKLKAQQLAMVAGERRRKREEDDDGEGLAP